MENLMLKEFLVTAQGYEKIDDYKQTIILYDVFQALDENDAKNQFNGKFCLTHNIMKVYSAVDLSNS